MKQYGREDINDKEVTRVQDNKERLENKDVSVENEEKISQVMENQESLFGGDEVFTEAIVVEKEEIPVDSSTDAEKTLSSNGDTAVFSFAKEKPQGSEIGHEELTVSDIESSAKEYYNANHAGDIEDKVKQLTNLANSGFGDEDTPSDVFIPNEADEDEDKKKDKKKKKKRGYVSNDDMELLSGLGGETLHPSADSSSPVVEEKQEDDVTEVTEKEEIPVNQDEFDDAVEFDEVDDGITEEEKQLFAALGGGEEEDAGKHFKKYEDMYENDEEEDEYTSREQDGTILMGLRKKAMSGMLSVFLTLVAAMVCVFFETAAVTSLPNPAVLEAGKFGVTYSMAMLQLLFLCVLFNLDGVKRAFKALRPSKPGAEGFAAVAVCVCTLHSVVSCITVGTDLSLRSYCSAGCIAMVLLSFNSFFKAQTTLSSFCIAASKKPKFSCEILDRAGEESVCLESLLDDESVAATVGKSEFVEGFFKKVRTNPKAAGDSVKRIIIVETVAAFIGIAAGLLSASFYEGFSAFAVVSLVSLPVNSLLATSLPFFKANSKAMDTQTAYLGEAVCDAYEDANVISFDDTEVFPPKGVKVSSIKTYENNRIDKVILYMARIFDELRGPLSFVFANSVQNIDEVVGKAQIKEVLDNGIRADIDGKSIIVGKSDFMTANELCPVVDNIDEAFVGSMGNIVYMAVDGSLAAKFYIKYAINKEFEAMLRSFYDAGVGVGIKTLDPGITKEFVEGFLRNTNYPIVVISKTKECAGISKVAEKTKSTIISLSGVHNFLKGFIRADKLRNIYRTNFSFALISMILGFVISTAGVLMLGSGAMSVLFIAIFQIIWCLPAILVSAFST